MAGFAVRGYIYVYSFGNWEWLGYTVWMIAKNGIGISNE